MKGSYKIIFMIFTFIFCLFFLVSPSQCLQWYSSGLDGYTTENSAYYPNYSYSPYFSFGNSGSRPYPAYGNGTYYPALYPAGDYTMRNSRYYPGNGSSLSRPYGGSYSQPYYNESNYSYFPDYHVNLSMKPSYNQPYNYGAYYLPQPYGYSWNPSTYGGGYNSYNYSFSSGDYLNYNYNRNQESKVERHEIAQMGSVMRLCIIVPGPGAFCFTADESLLENAHGSKVCLVPDNEMSKIAYILSDPKIYKWEAMTASSPYPDQDTVLLVYGDDPAGVNNFMCTIGKDYEAVIHLESLLPVLSGEAKLYIKQIIDSLRF